MDNKQYSGETAKADRPLSGGLSGNGQGRAESSGARILLVDDNPDVSRAMGIAFDVAGHQLVCATSPEEAYSLLALNRFDAILLDLNFTAGRTNGDEGFACLARILQDNPGAVVIVITAHSGVRIAVAAMKAGARDFVMKPWRNADLVAKVEAAIAAPVAAEPAPPPSLTQATDEGSGSARLIGDSAAIARVRELVRRLGPTNAGVMVSGPSGSGRTLVARALHEASSRVEIGLTIIDVRDPEAWDVLERAQGTLVLRDADRLDEVDQARLLARLPPAVRAIAIATDPHALGSRLKERTGTVEIALPPLSARGDDAMLLARHFAKLAADRHQRDFAGFTPAAQVMIAQAPWSDEVRGLAQAVERAVLLHDGGPIDAAALKPKLAAALSESAAGASSPLDLSLWDSERVMIEAALKHHHHNVTQAAEALGLSRGALYRRMAKYGL